MATREFVAVSWSPGQLIDEDSLDQINSNTVYLRDQAVDGKYMHLNNGVVDIGVKILAGRRQIAASNSDGALVRIGFAKMFTPGSIPIVTTSITSPGQTKIFSIISGIGQLQPNHQGFECKVQVAAETKANDKIAQSIFINWIALGY